MDNNYIKWISAHRNAIIIAVALGAIVSYVLPVDTLINAVAVKPSGDHGHSGDAPGHTGNPPPGHGGPIPGHQYDPSAHG
jgi:hypothetical protein